MNAMPDLQDQFAKKLTGYLDQGAAQIKAGTAYRLQQARAAAVARMNSQVRVPEAQLAPAYAGRGERRSFGGGLWKNSWLWLGVLVIVVASFGFQQWLDYRETGEIVELDAQILTSDLPIDAYIDRGFQTWLARPEP